MKHIFEQGDFNDYMDIRLDEAVKPVTEFYEKVGRTTVFISHKHDDLKDLMGLIGFLENNYHVKAYIHNAISLYCWQQMGQLNQNGAIGNWGLEMQKSFKIILRFSR